MNTPLWRQAYEAYARSLGIEPAGELSTEEMAAWSAAVTVGWEAAEKKALEVIGRVYQAG